MQLISGQKLALSQLMQQQTQFSIRVVFEAAFQLDLSSFALNTQDKLYHDDYMTFYNQPVTPRNEVKYTAQSNGHLFEFDLRQMNPAQTPRFVMCATVDHAQLSMKDIQHGKVELINQQAQVLASYALDARHFSLEKAVMLLEIYFKNGAWRIAAIGQGFNGGLKALVMHFGGDVTEDSADSVNSAQHHAPQQHVIERILTLDLKKKRLLDKVEKSAPHLIDLTKKSLISLEKNNLLDFKARVALVLDYSGSMYHQYKKGDVQHVIDRIMPLALNFDDDGCFECWAFAEKALRLSDISLDNLSNYISNEKGGYK